MVLCSFCYFRPLEHQLKLIAYTRLIYFRFKFRLKLPMAIFGVFVCWKLFLPASIHVCSSSRSFNPVGHAHEIFALWANICGAGKHKCEQ